MEPGEGWLLSEALFPGELWSLSPWLLQWLASSSNSCPDMILSISSSDIFDKELIHVRLGARDSLCSFFRTKNSFKPHKDSQNSLERYPDSLPSISILQGFSLILGQLSCLLPSTVAHYGLPLVRLPSSQATKPPRSSTLFESILSYPWNTTLQEQTPACLLRPNSNVTFFVNPSILLRQNFRSLLYPLLILCILR